MLIYGQKTLNGSCFHLRSLVGCLSGFQNATCLLKTRAKNGKAVGKKAFKILLLKEMKIFTLEIVTLLLLFAVFGKIKPMSKIFLFSSFLFQPPSEHIDPKVAILSLHRKNLMIPIASVSRVKRRRNTKTTNLENTNE